ncbi:charged multivesicular body protein 7-like isoform X2 [Physella acuta]|nr:charged multivesicular body protein 7-like isoform X2 [Physella acuta]XP_059148326.1 charged multivesicular body protein 7-like isoform X2 [Physella acuta]XP_059148328.1 charged multivesicular body protein 7-like isoform X2 [Physella acuta]
MSSPSPNFAPHQLLDEREASVLYSPFREKSLNIQSWNRKMTFWTNALFQLLKERKIITFNINLLQTHFERKGIKPKCLSTVLEELVRSKKIKKLDDFKKGSSWLSWGFNTLLKQPFSWGLSHLMGPSDVNSTLFICPDVVKMISEQLVDLHHSRMNHDNALINIKELRSNCQDLVPSDQDFEIVLFQLVQDKKIIIHEIDEQETVVKFCTKGTPAVEAIKDIELQVYQIQKTMKKLEKEIEILTDRMEGHMADARKYVKETKKNLALHSLRKKKGVQKTIDKKSASLSQLQAIVENIENASSNEMVVRACEAGVAAMKSLNSNKMLEKAEDVLLDVQEAVENIEDVNQILSSSLNSEEDLELEKDLEELLGESNKNPVKKNKTTEDETLLEALHGLMVDDLELPDVPSHLPSYSGSGIKQEKRAMESLNSS